MALKFGFQVHILLVLCLLAVFVAISLLNELSFSLRDDFLVFVITNRYICSFQLRFNCLTISSLPSLLGLRIDFRGVKRLSLFHSGVLICVSEWELGLLHAGFELFSVLLLVRRNPLLAHVRLIHAFIRLVVVAKRKVGFMKIIYWNDRFGLLQLDSRQRRRLLVQRSTLPSIRVPIGALGKV